MIAFQTLSSDDGKITNKGPYCQNCELEFLTDIHANENPKDLLDQLEVLVDAIRILTTIVTTPNPCSKDSLDAERRIESLHSKWRLEDTGFPKLFNACKQMKDALRLTSLEADKALDDAQRAVKTTSRLEALEEQSRKKVHFLCKEKAELEKENKRLIAEIKDQRKEKKLIARSVRKFFDAMNAERNDRSNDLTIYTQKSAPHLSYDNSMDEWSDNKNMNSTHLSNENIQQIQYVTSISTSEEDSEEITTLSSKLVTEEGCASIRFAQRQGRKTKIERSNIRSKKKIRQRNVLELSFPSQNVGLQFTSVSKKAFGRNDSNKALLVYGFLGFDDVLNRRPAFGARLVCIDGISTERWKMEDFIDYICTKKGPTKMSFRNEFLTTAQIAELKKCSSESITK